MAEITEWVKKIWKNRITEFPTRRELTKEDGSSEIVTVTRNEGTVSEEGDAFDADTMNNLEERIDAGFAEVTRKLGKDLSVRNELLSITASISREKTKTIANNIDISSYKYVEINGYIIPTEIMDVRGNIGFTYTKIYWESGMSSAAPCLFSINIFKDGHVTLYMTSINVSTVNNFSVTIYGYK